MQISEVLLHSNRAEARGEGLRGEGLGGGWREGERGELAAIQFCHFICTLILLKTAQPLAVI